jgi:hypothetical protein
MKKENHSMKKRQGLWHIGSFQYPHVIESENPLEEVWSWIARYGTRDYIKNHLHPEKSDIDWNLHIDYAIIRAKQSVEFRNSARNSTLLTKPLTLYYSFLNLTRAFLALGPEIIPASYHGLTFIKGDDLFSSGARLVKGTFTDYLSAFGFQWEKKSIISLRDSLAKIIEIRQDFVSLKKFDSFVMPVRVGAITGGPIYLDLLSRYEGFPLNWETEFPSLKEKCEINEDGQGFIINDKSICENHKTISNYLHGILHHDLIYNPMDSPWYIIRNVENAPDLSRASYYYIAVFILGSIVRYEPDLILELSQMNSETGWFIERFLQKAERFFPQLKMCEQGKTTIYF